MKFFNYDFHVSVIEDVRGFLEPLGHEVVSHNCSGHNRIWGRPTPPHLYEVNADNYVYPHVREAFVPPEADAYLSCYPPGFAMLYAQTQKPILMVVPIRYAHAFRNTGLEEFHTFLRTYPKLSIVANSRYDQAYVQHHVGVTPTYIPSQCAYVTPRYHPTTGPLLWDCRSDSLASQFPYPYLRKVYPQYRQDDLCNHSCIIWVPYNVSVMSFFEHYQMGIPLFVPTKRLLMELMGQGALGEMGECPGPLSTWLELADCYTLPYVQQFDSIAALPALIATTNLPEVSHLMLEAAEHRRAASQAAWRNVCAHLCA